LVERYFNYYPETKSVTDMRIPIYPLLLENRDFLGFQMIFKVPLNQIFSNFNTILYTITYRSSLIMVYCTFVIKLSLYLMVHSIVSKFEKIWLSGTLIIIRKSSVMDGRTNGHEDPYIPLTLVERGYNNISFTFTVPELWPFFS
jgi:hypothetical protein